MTIEITILLTKDGDSKLGDPGTCHKSGSMGNVSYIQLEILHDGPDDTGAVAQPARCDWIVSRATRPSNTILCSPPVTFNTVKSSNFGLKSCSFVGARNSLRAIKKVGED